jgi:hypothetical protein
MVVIVVLLLLLLLLLLEPNANDDDDDEELDALNWKLFDEPNCSDEVLLLEAAAPN